LACNDHYDVYGASSNGCSTQIPFSWRYAEQDTTSGDYAFGSRTYDPSKIAYTSPDTFHPGSTRADLSIGADPLNSDRYDYVNDDPVNLIDPTGHCFDARDDCLTPCEVNPDLPQCNGQPQPGNPPS